MGIPGEASLPAATVRLELGRNRQARVPGAQAQSAGVDRLGRGDEHDVQRARGRRAHALDHGTPGRRRLEADGLGQGRIGSGRWGRRRAHGDAPHDLQDASPVFPLEPHGHAVAPVARLHGDGHGLLDAFRPDPDGTPDVRRPDLGGLRRHVEGIRAPQRHQRRLKTPHERRRIRALVLQHPPAVRPLHRVGAVRRARRLVLAPPAAGNRSEVVRLAAGSVQLHLTNAQPRRQLPVEGERLQVDAERGLPRIAAPRDEAGEQQGQDGEQGAHGSTIPHLPCLSPGQCLSPPSVEPLARRGALRTRLDEGRGETVGREPPQGGEVDARLFVEACVLGGRVGPEEGRVVGRGDAPHAGREEGGQGMRGDRGHDRRARRSTSHRPRGPRPRAPAARPGADPRSRACRGRCAARRRRRARRPRSRGPPPRRRGP